MKLEEQLVSLELSKQLKEADYIQEGIWIWYWSNEVKQICLGLSSRVSEKGVVAPTVAEMGMAMRKQAVACGFNWDKWNCYSTLPKHGHHFYDDKNEANARAKCWLYLKKENLI